MPRSSRFYLTYVDDSGNENIGTLWTGLAIPAELWTEYLRRWLEFRKWLFTQHRVPASFELHAQVWLSAHPREHLKPKDLAILEESKPAVLDRGKSQRRLRGTIFEKGVKTIGTMTEARLFTVFSEDSSGPAKVTLYDGLLCFLEEFLAVEGAHGQVVVDGALDSGGHMRTAHRALLINRRRVIEDATMRSSADSQLLQMADFCAYAAFQTIQANPGRDEKFIRLYDNLLARLIARPFEVDEGRCIRGCDYVASIVDCPSERFIAG